MKNILILVVFNLMVFSCKKDDMTPAGQTKEEMAAIEVVEMMSNMQQAGTFMTGVHTTSGSVTVLIDKADATKRTLNFENFKTDVGPDLRIYLAEDLKAKNFVELGKLEKTSGNFLATVPSQADLTKQKYVLIWCKDFSVLFGSAELK